MLYSSLSNTIIFFLVVEWLDRTFFKVWRSKEHRVRTLIPINNVSDNYQLSYTYWQRNYFYYYT